MRDELIDTALRRMPEVKLPAHFRSCLLARLSEPLAKPRYHWAWTVVWFACGAALAPFVTLAFLRSSFEHWLLNPNVPITAVVVEAAISLLWFRRILKAWH